VRFERLFVRSEASRKVPAYVIGESYRMKISITSVNIKIYATIYSMKVVIGSVSPVKEEAVKRGFKTLFPDIEFIFECVKANSGISDQPRSSDEIRSGALGRIKHARELIPTGDFYVGLEGGVEELYGDLYNYGWVVIESQDSKKGYGRTFGFVLPPAIQHLIIHEGMEQGHATDKIFLQEGTKIGTGTIGPLTGNSITYADWYTPGVIGALVPFFKKDLY
jgi:inosine/xanthosine triphosphatase